MQMAVYANGVLVLMPRDDVPTFISHLAPMPCPPQPISQSQHQGDTYRLRRLSITSLQINCTLTEFMRCGHFFFNGRFCL